FKSFPDKVKLSFDGGLTAVVGPNGSGKSNISDAVRWVLGEQSTKTLRGDKMDDVIFAGTKTRRPSGCASVTLHIGRGNADSDAGSENDTVKITRKLYRSGASEYLIDGKQVRLKDINEMFMDTGLGRGGYSIIGQGKIAEIIGAKSDERRGIFEEAAGISKFRYKKEEAMRKLEYAAGNIVRLEDIVGELEGRIEPLREQSEKAHKFIELSGRKKTLEVSVFVNTLHEADRNLKNTAETLAAYSTQLNELSNETQDKETLIQREYIGIQEQSARIEKIRTEVTREESVRTQYQADLAVYNNDIKHSEEIIADIKEKRGSQLNSQAEIDAAVVIKSQEAAAITGQINEIKDEIETLTAEFNALDENVKTADSTFEAAETALGKLYIHHGELKVNTAELTQAGKDIDTRLSGLSDELSTAEKDTRQLTEELQSLTEDTDKLGLLLDDKANKLNGFVKLYEMKSQKYTEVKAQSDEAILEIKEKQHRVKVLTDYENSMEGFNASVKSVMKWGISGVHGTVASLLDVPQKYTLAVETALGAAFQNIIVANEGTARQAITMLKEKKAGRATFLPVTSVKGTSLDNRDLKNEDGFCALACDIAAAKEEYRGIVLSLLGRVAIAEDIDSASVIAKKYGYKFKTVTLDGQVINAGGSFTGGSSVRSGGILTRRTQINELKKEIEQLVINSKALENQSAGLAKEADKLSDSIECLKDERSLLYEDKIKFDAQLKHISEMKRQSENRKEETERRTEQLEDKKEENVRALQSAMKLMEETGKQISDLETDLTHRRKENQQLSQKRQDLSDKLTDARMRLLESGNSQENKRLEIAHLTELKDGLADKLMQMEEESARNASLIRQREIQVYETSQAMELSRERTDALNAEITVLTKEHTQAETRIETARSEIKDLSVQREGILQSKSRFDERLTAMQNSVDAIAAQLWDEYEMSRSEAENAAENLESIPNAKKELNSIKNGIKMLGTVNVYAIEEYREVSERHAYLMSQLNDVVNSKRELEKIIEDLTEKMRDIFSVSFEHINMHFQRIFKELFSGGKAELSLTDPDDILESGIEINAAPPGKVIKNLISLSGGEQALTAIAVYFSILTIKPAPFCILDEIDAALDEVNVMKYAAYLKNFTDNTQFVIITHRRGTMEAGSVIYGVTMQDDGISKLLKMPG
ncbi:MAG: chromosome segregation protein SMC, partial [Oscillospiraceae bacterium]|nr:chromosome segregation protein SMC [Oscillospiraceae bacterium]